VATKLIVEGGQPANDLHITLVYLGKSDQFNAKKMQTLHDIVSSIAKEYTPLDITLTGYGVFAETDDGPCLHAVVGLSDALDSLQETVAEAVASYGMPPQGKGSMNGQYKPHITLAYGESAAPPEVPPVTEFKIEWLRSTFGATEGLFRLQGTRKSVMMKAVFDESQHPRDESGKFSESGGGEGSRVFMTPDDVIEESTWGGKKQYVIRDPKTGKGSGRLISEPVNIKNVPETLYHATTNLPAVKGSGYLRAASDGGGMGGGNGMPGVSFTTSKADAELMTKELRRTVDITHEAPDTAEAMKAKLEGYAREDEKAGGLQKGDLQRSVDYSLSNWEANHKSSSREWNGESWDTSPAKDPEKMKVSMQRLAKETFTQYLQARDMDSQKLLNTKGADFHQNDKYAMLKDPLLYGSGEDFAKMDPAKIGIVTTSKKNLPGRALIRAGSDDFLHEVRVHADVPLETDTVYKDGEGGSGLTAPTEGGGTPLMSLNHDKRRKPIDGQVYTAFTPDGSLGTASSPGIMKDGAPAGMASDSTAAFGTSDLNNGGRIAPEQGMFKKPRRANKAEVAIPGTEKHMRVLDAHGWEFHANDHDSVVYSNPKSDDEVRVWSSGHWIRYTKDQKVVSQGDTDVDLGQNLGVKKDEFGGGQGQGQGLAVATAPEFTKRPVKPEFKFAGAVGPKFEDKDVNGDLKKEDPTTGGNMAISAEPSPEMSDDREDKLRAEDRLRKSGGAWQAPKTEAGAQPSIPMTQQGRNPERHHNDPRMRDNEPFTPPEGITQPMALSEYRTPKVQRTVDMVENGVLVVRHTFYGDDDKTAKHMEDAHREADASLDASMDGKPYKDVDITAVRKAEGPAVILARHGSTDFNSGAAEEGGPRIRGWIDVPLNTEGHADAKRVAAKIAKEYPHVDEIHTSDLSRAADTAQAISDALGGVPITKTRDLRPWDLGDYNGKPVEGIKDKLDALVMNHSEKAPNGESFDDFMDRFCPYLEAAQADAKKGNKVIVLVAHTRNVRAAEAVCDRAKMTPELMMGPNDITEPGEFAVMKPTGDGWGFKVAKAHDAGVQPEAHDEKPKFPAGGIAPGTAIIRAEAPVVKVEAPIITVLPAPVNIVKADNAEVVERLGEVMKEINIMKADNTERLSSLLKALLRKKKRTVQYDEQGNITGSIEEEME
jgi:2'-5' RNA ligase